MADGRKIEKLSDFTPNALSELRMWLEPWFKRRLGAGEIGPIDSTDNVGLPWGVQSIDPVTGDEPEGYILQTTGVGGSIWAPNLSSGQQTIADFVRNHPCGVSFWPMDDIGPGAVDVIAGNDMIENPVSSGTGSGPPVGQRGSYVNLYEQTGPFVGSDAKAIHFDGDASGFSSRGAMLYRNGFVDGWPSAWTIAGWVVSDVSDISLRKPLTIYGGGTSQTSLGPNGVGCDTGSGTFSALNPDTFDATEWHHICASYDGVGTIKFYFDGVLKATTSSVVGTPVGAGYWRFSGAGNSSAVAITNYWKGLMSSWAFFNCAISDDDIAILYSLGGPASSGDVPTADGDGGSAWKPPTIELDSPAGRYDTINLGDGLGGTDNGDGSNTIHVNTDGSTIEVSGDALRVKDGGITSAKIADGAIVNADVNASAAIDPTKLSHPGGTSTFLRADGTWAAAGTMPTDSHAWMPLTTTVGGDDVLVFDASHQLVPTYVPL